MPRNTREWAQRKIDSASNNIDWAGKHINEVMEVYKEQHPEIAAHAFSFLQSFAVIMDALTELKKSF